MGKLQLPNIQTGIIREAAIDTTLVPENSCEFALNLNFDRIGAIQLRSGISALGTVVESGKTTLGMANYINNARDTFRLLAKLNSSVYSFDGSTWTEVRTALTTNSKARFTNFVDYTFMINGNANQACQTYNASGNFGTNNALNLQKGDLIENFRSRIWIADSATDNLYYSDVVNTDNTISGGSNYIQVSPQDGENGTGLIRHPRALLYFKQNHIYRIFSVNSTDPDPFIKIGTYSNESIVDAKDGLYFHHSTGFYKFNFDGRQIEISRPIIDIIKAIPRSNYENIVGWTENDYIYWSVGDVTLDGVTINNLVCRYSISTQVWTLYNYVSEMRSAITYDDGTNLIVALGDDTGYVLRFNNGNDDNGSPINYEFYTHWIYLTQLKSANKELTEIAVIHENAQGVNVSYQLDTAGRTEWEPVDQIKKDLYDTMTLNAKKFTRIRFRINGNSTGDSFIFRGFELLNVLTSPEIKR